MEKYNDHYSALKVLSYNAIFSLIVTKRNYGKTWAFKRRAFRRAMKHGRKTIWLRTFKKEVKEASRMFYTSSDLMKFCGIIPYDKEKNTGNFKQEGNTFYYRRTNKDVWKWFIKICAVSDSNAMRSADDVKVDTIVYDEFTTTYERQLRYHGNVVADFIDLFFSAKREHIVRCFFLGNKECIRNPFLVYFNIKPLPLNYEGIKSYRNGSIVIEQRNNSVKRESDYEEKVKDLLNETPYGNYIYNNAYKNSVNIRIKKAPKGAGLYVQLDINNYPVRISVLKGIYYFTNKVDILRRVCTLEPLNKYQNEALLIKRYKSNFIGLINALADNRVYYDSATTYEAIQPFLQWLSI